MIISAIILNYLNPQLTAKSVDYLLKAASQSALSVEVIVVDNSASETAEELRELLPKEVTVIENEENIGFAAANNQGIRRSGGEIILIMNNDLFINEEVLKKGTEFITANEDAGVWAPKLVDESGKPQRSCARFPTLRGVIGEYLFKYQHDNRIAVTANNAASPVEVDTVIGACMFIKKDVLWEAGLFDEDYFFTMEDVDLCYKIKAMGYRVIFDPCVEAIHLYGASQSAGWHDDPFLHKSRKRYFKKHFNQPNAMLARMIIDFGIAARKLKHKIF